MDKLLYQIETIKNSGQPSNRKSSSDILLEPLVQNFSILSNTLMAINEHNDIVKIFFKKHFSLYILPQSAQLFITLCLLPGVMYITTHFVY